jgi:hypothetical protein
VILVRSRGNGVLISLIVDGCERAWHGVEMHMDVRLHIWLGKCLHCFIAQAMKGLYIFYR